VSISWSLPSRGAWIEIDHLPRPRHLWRVAPLAGSVDRNLRGPSGLGAACPSLPSRGAWIEIPSAPTKPRPVRVAPLAGSVDRNKISGMLATKVGMVAPLAGSV